MLSLLLPLRASGDRISNETLNQLIKLSGAHKQVSEISAIAWGGFLKGSEQGPTIPSAELEKVKKAMESAFNPQSMMEIISNEIQTNITEKEGLELITWYISDEGAKITAAEERASSNEGIQQMFREARTLLIDKDRVNRAIEIDRLISGTEMTLSLQRYSEIALFTAFQALKEPTTPVNIAEFNTRMYTHEQKARAQAQQLTILSIAFCYKNIEETLLNNYIEFLKSEAAKKYTKVGMEGFKEAFRKSTDQMALLLAKIAREQLETIDNPPIKLKPQQH
jgi:hypothetical protein